MIEESYKKLKVKRQITVHFTLFKMKYSCAFGSVRESKNVKCL